MSATIDALAVEGVLAITAPLDVPTGLELAVKLHGDVWRERLKPFDDPVKQQTFSGELADPVIVRTMRAYFELQFAALVYRAHHVLSTIADRQAAVRAACAHPTESAVLVIIVRWLTDGGARLLPEPVGLDEPVATAGFLQKQKSVVRQGLLEAYVDAYVWNRPRTNELRSKVASFVAAGGRVSWRASETATGDSPAQRSFEVLVRQARIQQRARTGLLAPARRAYGPDTLSASRFRRTMVAQRLSDLFPPMFAGVYWEETEDSMRAAAERRVSSWLKRPAQRPVRPLLLDNHHPRLAVVVPEAVWEAIERHLPPRRAGGIDDRTALSAILTVARANIQWSELPSSLGVGSGQTAWSRRRQWVQTGVWPMIVAAVSADPETRDIDLGALDTRR